MLLHFADKDTEAIFSGRAVKRLPVELQEHAFRKLRYLDAAVSMVKPSGSTRIALQEARRTA